MRKIQDTAAFVFIFCVGLLSLISVLGVWEFFNRDVIGKSFFSIGLLAVVAIIVMVAARFMDKSPEHLEVPQGSAGAVEAAIVINPLFTELRHLTLVVLIASVSLLALVGVLAIWEVIAGDTVYKSLATMGIFAFSSFIIVVTCLDRENHKLLHRAGEKKSSMGIGSIILLSILGLWIMSFLLSFGRMFY